MTDEDDWLEGLAREARGELSPGDEPVPGTPEVAPEVVADQVTADVAKRLPELQALQTQLAQLHTPALDDVAREGAARLAEDNKALIANAQEPQAKALSAESTLATRPPPAALSEQQVPPVTAPPAAAVVKAPEVDKTPPPIVEQAKGLEQRPPPAAAPPPAKTQDAAATDDYAMQMPEMYTAPPRKKTGVLDDEGAMWAALLDVFVNRGRGTPQILARAGELADKRRNDQLDEDYRVAQINSLNRHGWVDPRKAALEARKLDQADARLTQGDERLRAGAEREQRLQAAAALHQAAWDMKNDPAKAGARRQYLYDTYPKYFPAGSLDGLSAEDLNHMGTTISQRTALELAPQKAEAAAMTTAAQEGARAETRFAYRGKLAETAASRIEAEDRARMQQAEQLAEARSRGTQIGKGDLGERRFAAEQIRNYNKDYGKEMDIVGLMSSIDANGGVVPQSIAERIATDKNIAGYAIDPKRLDAVSAKRLILEIWGRDQSGAAISQSEIKNFKNQVSDMSWADDRQIESAYNTMRDMLQTRLRSGALGNAWAPELLAIHMRDGDPWAFLGQTREQAQAQSFAKPPPGQGFSGRPAEGGGAGEPPRVAPPAAAPMPTTNSPQTAYAQPPPAAAPSAAQAGGKRDRHVQKIKDGKPIVVVMPLSDNEARKLEASGKFKVLD